MKRAEDKLAKGGTKKTKFSRSRHACTHGDPTPEESLDEEPESNVVSPSRVPPTLAFFGQSESESPRPLGLIR
jgi:hypothetical protein